MAFQERIDGGGQCRDLRGEGFEIDGWTLAARCRQCSRFEELTNRDIERGCKANEDGRRRVGLRELDTTQVLVVQIRELRETFLFQIPFETEAANLRAERS